MKFAAAPEPQPASARARLERALEAVAALGVLAHALFLPISVAGMQIALAFIVGALLALRLLGRRVWARSPLDLPCLALAAAAVASLGLGALAGSPPVGWHEATLWRSFLAAPLLLSGIEAWLGKGRGGHLPRPADGERARRTPPSPRGAGRGPGRGAEPSPSPPSASGRRRPWCRAPSPGRSTSPGSTPSSPSACAPTRSVRWCPSSPTASPRSASSAGTSGSRTISCRRCAWRVRWRCTAGEVRPRLRALLGVASLAAAAAVVLTLSRAAWVTLALAGALVAVGGARKLARVALPLVAVGCLAMGLNAGVRTRLAHLASPDATGDRKTIWRVCRAVVADHPLTGVGWGNFPRRSLPYWERIAPDYPLRAWCHDSFFSAWAEGGPLLFGALVAFWALHFLAFLRWRRASDGLGRAASLGALAALAGMLANSLAHDILYSSEAMFALGFALAVGAALARRSEFPDAV